MQSEKKYGFEVHITIECNDNKTLELFKEKCEILDVKPIVIDLVNTKQVMTSKTFYCSFLHLTKHLHEQREYLKKFFNVLRVKVESEPKFVEVTKFDYLYYEIHVPCVPEIGFDKIRHLKRRWHMSKNMFKDDVRMLTCREKDPHYIEKINTDIKWLQNSGLVHDNFKHHYEYAIYDSNENLDKGWIM